MISTTIVIIPEHLVHQRSHAVHILVADLDEDTAALGQQVARHRQAVAQVGEVGVDAVAPGVAEGLHLFGLARQVVGLAVLHVAAGGGPLEVGVELDAIGRVDVDALHLALQPLALGQARHHLQPVAQDHAVRPVLVVRIEFGPRFGIDTVEIGEQVGRGVVGGAGGGALQVLDQRLGMDLLLDVERRRLDDQIRPVRHILAPPHQLRIEIAITPLVSHLDGPLHPRRDKRLQFRRRRILPRRLVMGERVDGEGFFAH